MRALGGGAHDGLVVERHQVFEAAAAARDDQHVGARDAAARQRVEAARWPRRCAAAAPSPCTGTGHSRMRRGKRRSMVVRMSWMTAPCALVTTPMTSGSSGQRALAGGVEQALGGEPHAQHLDAREQGAGAGVFHALDDELVGRAVAVGGDRPVRDHLDAVLRHQAEARDGGFPDHAGDLCRPRP